MRSFGLLAVFFLALGAPQALAQSDNSLRSDQYILSQEFIEAEVVRVHPPDRKLTVRGANQGHTRTFNIPEGTRITIAGREARLRDLRRGDTVMLAMKPTVEDVVIARVRVPETPKTLEERRAEPVQVAQALPAELPRTASRLPALLLVGALAVAGAMWLRRRAA